MDVSQVSLLKVIENKSCARVINLFEDYFMFLREGNGSLSSFWMSYVDMVGNLLGLVRASREGDWLLHMASIRALIPWCFTYDRINYARYLPYYYANMFPISLDQHMHSLRHIL